MGRPRSDGYAANWLACAPPVEGPSVVGEQRDEGPLLARVVPHGRRGHGNTSSVNEGVGGHSHRPELYPNHRTRVKGDLRKIARKCSAGNFFECQRWGSLCAELETALRTADPVHTVQEELGANRALQARAPEDRDQLLVERAMKADDRHSVLNTPVTRPRIWTWSA